MQKDKIIVGLDIGSTKVCAIVARKDLNDPNLIEILGVGKTVSEGVTRGVVINIDKTVEAINKAVREASQMSGIDIRIVNVGIAGQHIKSVKEKGSITRHSVEDEISSEDVVRLVNDMYKIPTEAGTQILHVMPQDFTVDSETGITEPIGMSGVKLEANFHIITAQTTALNNVNRCVKKSGLEVQEMILEPIASSLAVLTKEERGEGVVLVDIGGGTTDIAIFYDGILRHSAVIPFGGQIITSDIKMGCRIIEHQAELLKVTYGKAIAELAKEDEYLSIPGNKNRQDREISVRNLAHIIEARMTEIVEDVHKEILRSGFYNTLSQGIVLTGGGSLLSGIKELFEYHTGLPVRIGHPTEYLTKKNIDLVKKPIFATAIGLVMAGFRAIDDRNLFDKTQNKVSVSAPEQKTAKESKKDNLFSGFFNKLLERTKSLLIDDVDDKNDY
ncbi:MAG: cell division protein FtsA [Thermonemataceae bacterium]|nr:cell division protein FtsA [Thermonemataceae bacterium]